MQLKDVNIFWNTNDKRQVADFIIFEKATMRSYGRSLDKYLCSRGACCAGWPSDFPILLVFLFASGFETKEIEYRFTRELLMLEGLQLWSVQFIHEWRNTKGFECVEAYHDF